MSKYTAEQVRDEMRAWRSHTGFESARLLEWADALVALLRERESASAQVADGGAFERGYIAGYRAALGAAASKCREIGTALDHAGEPYVRYADAIRCGAAVAGLYVPGLNEPSGNSGQLPDVLPSELRIESWPVQQGGMHVGMPRGVKINHVTTGHVCICNSERSQHKNRDIALAGIKAMLAAAPKPEKE